MTGGAVMHACVEVRAELLQRAAVLAEVPVAELLLADGVVVGGPEPVPLLRLLEAGAVEATFEFHHVETQPLDPETGQGDAHVQFAFAAHRAVVDVDRELGLVRVVEMATAQDVGTDAEPARRRRSDRRRHRAGGGARADGGDPGGRRHGSATRPSPTT